MLFPCEYPQGSMSYELTAHLSDFNLFQFSKMVVSSKARKPDNFESHNALKRSFINIRCLRLNLIGCKSFLESSSPGILAPFEANLDDSIDSGNFCMRGYLLLI